MTTLIKPFVGEFVTTQLFGENPGSYQSICRPDKSHNGVDYATPVGTPLVAAMAGVVTQAGKDATGYGLHVRIKGPGGDGLVYGHMSKIAVAVKEAVSPGDIIGYSGNTGNSTGPHLHFEYRTDITRCTTCKDPMPLMATPNPDLPSSEPTVSWDNVNVRLAPGLEGKVVGRLYAGDKVEIVQDTAEKIDGYTWVAIKLYIAKEALS